MSAKRLVLPFLPLLSGCFPGLPTDVLMALETRLDFPSSLQIDNGGGNTARYSVKQIV
jgi:hypothetical protein